MPPPRPQRTSESVGVQATSDAGTGTKVSDSVRSGGRSLAFALAMAYCYRWDRLGQSGTDLGRINQLRTERAQLSASGAHKTFSCRGYLYKSAEQTAFRRSLDQKMATQSPGWYRFFTSQCSYQRWQQGNRLVSRIISSGGPSWVVSSNYLVFPPCWQFAKLLVTRSEANLVPIIRPQ